MPNARYFSTTTEDKQSALDDAWEAAPDGDLTLRAELRKFERAARLLISDGPLQSSSSNGHSGSWMPPGDGAPAPVEDARVWRELINLYDSALLWLLTGRFFDIDSADTSFVYYTREMVLTTDVLPIASPTDIQIDAKMRDLLVKPTEYRGDYSGSLVANGMQFT